MSETSGQTQLVSEWQLQVDELTTNLLLNGLGETVISGLKELSTAARNAGFVRLEQVASGVLEALSAKAGEPAAADEVLRLGLATVQQILSEVTATEVPAPPNPLLNPLAQDAELVGDFITESREHLSSIENHLLTLEKNPEEKESVHAVFRGFHTIKGLAGFLEFMPIRDVAHDVETLLDLARNEKLTISGSVVDVVLESVDYLKQALQVVEASVQGDSSGIMGDNSQLLVRLQRLINGGPEQLPAADSAPSLTQLSTTLHSANSMFRPVAEAASDSSVKEQPEEKSKSGDGTAAAAVIRVQTANLTT